MTRPIVLLAGLAGACTVSTAAEPAADARPLGAISWSIDTPAAPGADRVQVRFRTGSGNDNSHWSSAMPLADLAGLAPAALRATATAPVRFSLAREAGRLDCEGSAAAGSGNGTCAFSPSSAFAEILAARGIGRPSDREAYHLTLADVRAELVDELRRHDYRTPTMKDLVAMGIHRVTPQYVRDMAAAGYRLGTADGLVKFRIFNIDADYIRAMAAIGPQFTRLSPDDLVQFKIFKVSPELVRAYQALGYDRLDPKDLTTMAIHNVSPGFIGELAQLGYRNIPADKLVAMRIHGVTPDFIRALQRDGVALPSADQLVRLRLAGYRPGRP